MNGIWICLTYIITNDPGYILCYIYRYEVTRLQGQENRLRIGIPVAPVIQAPPAPNPAQQVEAPQLPMHPVAAPVPVPIPAVEAPAPLQLHPAPDPQPDANAIRVRDRMAEEQSESESDDEENAPPQEYGNVGPVPPHGNGNVAREPPQGNGNVGPAPPQANDNVGPAPPQANDNVGPTPPQANDNVGPAPPRPGRRRTYAELLRENQQLFNDWLTNKIPRILQQLGVDMDDI